MAPEFDTNQERNLRRLSFWTLLTLFVSVGFICWWLYQGVGFFKDEMSFSSAFGPRKGPRVPLPPGTVPRDGMGYDRAQLNEPALSVRYDSGLGAKLYHDNCEFCHAASGRGDVPAGIEYDPQPPQLTRLVPQRSDAQLFAAISDGMTTPEIDVSPPLGPRWHQFALYLNEADRRQLVDYLRATFGTGRELGAPATTVQHPAYHIVGNPPAKPKAGGH